MCKQQKNSVHELLMFKFTSRHYLLPLKSYSPIKYVHLNTETGECLFLSVNFWRHESTVGGRPSPAVSSNCFGTVEKLSLSADRQTAHWPVQLTFITSRLALSCWLCERQVLKDSAQKATRSTDDFC